MIYRLWDIRATTENVTDVNRRLYKKYKLYKNITKRQKMLHLLCHVTWILWLSWRIYDIMMCCIPTYITAAFAYLGNISFWDLFDDSTNSVRWLDNQKKQLFPNAIQNRCF